LVWSLWLKALVLEPFRMRPRLGKTLFTATVGVGFDGFSTITNHDSTAVHATLNSSVPTIGFGMDSLNQFAAAGPNGLRASARATMRFDDLQIRRVNGDRSGTTQASLNLDLSGTSLANVNAFADSSEPGSTAYAYASAAATVLVTDKFPVGEPALNGANRSAEAG
jgi:hypothetical protein